MSKKNKIKRKVFVPEWSTESKPSVPGFQKITWRNVHHFWSSGQKHTAALHKQKNVLILWMTKLTEASSLFIYKTNDE